MRTLIASLALLLPATASAEKPYFPKFARVEQPAAVLDFALCTKPSYPKASLRNEETGTVTLLLTVAATGTLIGGKVERSSGFRDLDKAALGALMSCKAKPASINGIPVQGPLRMQYVWTLD